MERDGVGGGVKGGHAEGSVLSQREELHSKQTTLWKEDPRGRKVRKVTRKKENWTVAGSLPRHLSTGEESRGTWFRPPRPLLSALRTRTRLHGPWESSNWLSAAGL